MRLKLILLACLVSTAIVPQSLARTAVQPARKSAPQQPAESAGPDISQLTIAGVAWGQYEVEVLAELREAGYTITGRSKDELKLYDRLIESFIAENRYDPLSKIEEEAYVIYAEKPNEQVSVEMWATPDGWKVARVGYWYKGGVAPKELDQIAQAKYRDLGFTIGGTSWVMVCLSDELCGEFPSIKIDPYFGQFSLDLTGGSKGDALFVKSFEEAVAKRKGLTKPSF